MSSASRRAPRFRPFVGLAGPAAETRFLEFFAANMRSAQDAPRPCPDDAGVSGVVRPGA